MSILINHLSTVTVLSSFIHGLFFSENPELQIAYTLCWLLVVHVVKAAKKYSKAFFRSRLLFLEGYQFKLKSSDSYQFIQTFKYIPYHLS